MSLMKPPAKPRRAGGREGICPRCRTRIQRNEMVKVAPGRGLLWKHVTCPKVG